MPMLEDRLRQVMAEETARLQAAPDLVERVIRGSRRRRKRGRLAALAASLAVVATAPLYLTTTQSAMQAPAVSEAPGPPAIDDTPPMPSKNPTLGDLGDGRKFGHVKVGYLPDGLRWGDWSVDFGDQYATAWNYDGKASSGYCVEIYVYENEAVKEVDDRVQSYRDDEYGANGEGGKDVTVGGRTGYMVVANVGEDGQAGSPTLILNMGERRRAEIMFSYILVKRLGGAKAVERELRKIAEGLTAVD